MGFFDFLSAPAQDPTLEDQELFKQKKNSGVVPTLDDPSKRIESTAQPPQPKAAEPPKAKDPMAERNRLASEIEGLKVQVAKEIAAERIVKTGFSGKMDGSHLERAAIKEIAGKGPEEAARGLEAHAQSRGVDLKKLPSFQRLEQAVLAYKRAQREPAVQQYQAQSKVTLAQRDIPRLEQQVKSATDELMKVKAQIAEAPSARMEADLKKQEETLAYKMGSLTDQLNAAKNTTQQAAQDPQPIMGAQGDSQDAGSMDASPEFMAGLDSAFRSAGIDRRDVSGAVNEGLDDLNKMFDGKLDLNGPVVFKYALPYVIQAMGPEAQVEWSQWLLKMQQEQKQAQPGIEEPSGVPGSGERERDELQKTRDDIKINLANRKAAMQDLANAQELQSWPAIVAFVLLGMLIGPNGAFAFFSNARRKRELQGWIQSIDLERKELKDLEEEQLEQKKELRREAVARLQKERDYKRNRDDSLTKLYINHKLILERARANASPQNRAIVSKLEGDFARTLKLMQDHHEIMKNDYIEEGDPKKIRATREYDRLKGEADFIDQKLRALTEQLVPGTYSSEEDDASGGTP